VQAAWVVLIKRPLAGATSILLVMDESNFLTKPRHH
jgi:hypothetical protein